MACAGKWSVAKLSQARQYIVAATICFVMALRELRLARAMIRTGLLGALLRSPPL